MLVQNCANDVKIEADQVNYTQFSTFRPQIVSEVKIENIENDVKVQEDDRNMMVFYSTEDRVKAQDLTDQQDKRKPIKKAPKTKPIKTKTIIIQKNSSGQEAPNKKKCKDKRTGKYEQSLAQRFIKKITGYHYCKNFNQFYHKQMSVYIREKNQLSQSEINDNQIQEHKNKIIDSMTRTQFIELTNFVLASLKAYEPYMKKYKPQSTLYLLFEGSDFAFFELFFRSLFKKVYEIMILVTYRKCLGAMFKDNINEMQIKCLNYNGLDQIGESQIAQAFDIVFWSLISQVKCDQEFKRELLRLKLQKLAQMQ